MKQEKSNPQTEWSQRVALWQESGKSARKWCLENDVNYVSFLTWRRLLLENGSQHSVKKSSFSELSDSSLSSCWIEISFPGARLQLSRGCDKEALNQCLKMLEGW